MKNSILDDHIRVKKKFIAPMNTIPQNGLYYFDEINDCKNGQLILKIICPN